ncbi:von Willebrand factor type A domain-containing protein [Cohnella sp. WQ 127256]|uniref:vWA domain-containing protein n=1 Tax=Cohnella sp. WQ 127256 TaxID=2938790 RepID=UPI00211794AF|nr:von Willebrand factor type A domain-containing protein [Cohnella sp. WQ 127256]
MKRKLSWILIIVSGMIVSGCSSSSNDRNNDSAPLSAMSEAQDAPIKAMDDDMFFQDYGKNSFVNTEDDRVSTFAVDVDTGAYTIARAYIEDGALPPHEAVRTEEFINYFDLDYEPPTDDTFSIQVDAGPSPFAKDNHQLVRIGIKGKEIDSEERKPANLTFVIDVSGSMDRDNRIDLVKESLELLVEQLKEDDKIGIVVYGSTAHKVLDPTLVNKRGVILDAIKEIKIENATNVEEGLLLGYQMANETFEENKINRVILCSDGVANVGETGVEGILAQIERYSEQNIYLSTFGYGMGNYNDVLMEQLADKGNGAYAYIEDRKEAKRVFQEKLTGTLLTIAKDAKIQVEFDPEKVDSYRLIGYENRAISDQDFRNNRVDGGEVGAGHSVTALYQVRLTNKAAGDFGEITIRYKNDDTAEIRELTQEIHLTDELSKNTKFLFAVAKFAEALRDEEGVSVADLKKVRQLAKQNAQTKEQKAFIDLVERAIELSN